MRRTTIWTAAVAAAVLAVGAGAALADHWMGGHFTEHAGERLERIAELLDLSPAQRQELEALEAARLEGLEQRLRSLHQDLEEVRAMAAAERPDATAIGERVIALHREHEALAAERQAFHDEVAALLTPEQRERWEALQAMHEELEDQRPGLGHRGHRPGWRD